MFYAIIASCYMKVGQNINFTKTKTRRCINNDFVYSPLNHSTTEKKVYRALNAQQHFMNRKELKLSIFYQYVIALKPFHTVASACVQKQVELVLGLRILTLFCSFACVLCFNF